MCGIVGFIGQQDAKEILLRGLEKLEYRGYDSAGVAFIQDADREKIDLDVHATIGIRHTWWVTHGVPSRRNTHLHQSAIRRFAIVHNGVIENFAELKQSELNVDKPKNLAKSVTVE